MGGRRWGVRLQWEGQWLGLSLQTPCGCSGQTLARGSSGEESQRLGGALGGGVAVRAGALAVEGTGSSRSAVTLRGGDVARSWLEVGLQEWLQGLGRACDA